VSIASRISGLSAPGEVLVSDIVCGLARTSARVVFEDRGEQALKGVGEPERVWAVTTERGLPHLTKRTHQKVVGMKRKGLTDDPIEP
jgi:class 3 adenylate cyclase